MHTICVGNTYRIYDDSLEVHDRLPAHTYNLCFTKQSGFFLEKHSDFAIGEKVYGVHEAKVEKVLDSFKMFERNLGVILSGHKGIGKSLFAKMLAAKAVAAGYPVIIAAQYIPGIAAYLEELDQEVIVLFDEFDKTFGKADSDDGVRANPQTEMLTLFDGVTHGKKLFVITCNQIHDLNDYLINRPGRFHYHFRFDFPDAGQIREYLQDKLDEQHWGEIDKVIHFACRVDLNYDCLRAIAFELSRGEKFEVAIKDLNIINNNDISYKMTLYLKDGRRLVNQDYRMDMFDKTESESVWFKDENGDWLVRAEFGVADCIYNAERGVVFVDPENLHLSYSTDEDDKEKVETVKCIGVENLMIERRHGREMHYVL